MTPDAQLAALDYLAGIWRSDDFEATYTNAEGGMVLSVNKSFKAGKVVFYEFERFDIRDGKVTMQPFLAGKTSPASFPLHALDPARRRAHFRNAQHDFPQDLIYECPTPDRLLITLTGVEEGENRRLHFDLRRQR